MVFIIGKPGLSSGFLTGQLRTDRSQAIEAEVAIKGEPSNPPTLNTVISPVDDASGMMRQ